MAQSNCPHSRYCRCKALKHSTICNEPSINNGHKVESSSNAPTEADSSKKTLPSSVSRDQDNHGNLLTRGFWSHGTDCIAYVRITNLNSKSYQNGSSDKVLAEQEKDKKHKYLAP
eukprot:scaffold4052_cov64-Attheya_sp.AAC.5